MGVIKKRWGISKSNNGPELARAIYGHQHFCEEHTHQNAYKPRLLRNVRDDMVFGFPNGIPGGWDSENKIHFVCHSMGAQVVRYLQYLLSIDYFEQNQFFDERKNRPKIPSRIGMKPNFEYRIPGLTVKDKSDWIASVSTLNGCMNGSPSPHNLDYDYDTLRTESVTSAGKHSWLSVILVKLH
jgi:triacylglycerol esterase/lipase EstA (alpha/beta hydrolase family)